MSLQLPFTPLGVVFDVDETILDNGHQTMGQGYHEKFRLQAVHEIGEVRNIPALQSMTIEQSTLAFKTAFEHTFSASLWNMLCMAGVRSNPLEPDETDELHMQITRRKNELYEQALRTVIQPIHRAGELIEATHALCDSKLAIASTARRVDIDTFLSVNGLDRYFLPERIFARESFTYPKPNKESFTLGFTSLGIPEHESRRVIAFEDAPNGVASAKASGLYVIALTTHYSRQELSSGKYPADMVIDSYDELFT